MQDVYKTLNFTLCSNTRVHAVQLNFTLCSNTRVHAVHVHSFLRLRYLTSSDGLFRTPGKTAYARQDVDETFGNKTIKPHLYREGTMLFGSKQLYRLPNNSTRHIWIQQLHLLSFKIQWEVGWLLTREGVTHH